jgi:hypothetical protein
LVWKNTSGTVSFAGTGAGCGVRAHFEVDEGLPCPNGTALLRAFAEQRPFDFVFLKRGNLIDLNNPPLRVFMSGTLS